MRASVAGLLLLLASAAHGSPALPAPVREAGLVELGTGRYTWWGLHIYDATLRTRDGAPPDYRTPFALTLRYARDLNGARIAERSMAEMRRLAPAPDAVPPEWLAQMLLAFPDVRQGESLTGYFDPGTGTRFYHGAQPTAAVGGEAFARAFFGIWLDPRTDAPELRARLLGDTRR